jgi:sugar O-acyltransferase (sialic acid O-acetyltransferase NeuD family)
VLGGTSWLEQNKEIVNVVVAIGNPKLKSKIVKSIQHLNHVRFPVLIHERALVQDIDLVKIGKGSILCAGVVMTTAIEVGVHVLLNLNVTVGHDSTIGDYTSVMPGVNIAGNVVLGSEVMIGSGANIINNIKVGSHSMIGSGSVVNHDIPAASTAAGVPARVIK